MENHYRKSISLYIPMGYMLMKIESLSILETLEIIKITK